MARIRITTSDVDDAVFLAAGGMAMPLVPDEGRIAPTRVQADPILEGQHMLVAARRLEAGTFLGNYEGQHRSLASTQFDSLARKDCREELFSDCVTHVQTPLTVWPVVIRPPEELARRSISLMNHSCVPNCRPEHNGDGTVAFRSARDVSEGEELTWDYSASTDVRNEHRRTLCLCKERCAHLPDEGRSLLLSYAQKPKNLWKRNMLYVLRACDPGCRISTRSPGHGIAGPLYQSLPEWLQRHVCLLVAMVREEELGLSIDQVKLFLELAYVYLKTVGTDIPPPFRILAKGEGGLEFTEAEEHAAVRRELPKVEVVTHGGLVVMLSPGCLLGWCIFWNHTQNLTPEKTAQEKLRGLRTNKTGSAPAKKAIYRLPPR